MTSIAVIGFDDVSMSLANNMSGFGQNLSESLPSVSIENAAFQVFHFVVEPFESLLVTLAQHPRNHSVCSTVNCFDDPQLSFFLPI